MSDTTLDEVRVPHVEIHSAIEYEAAKTKTKSAEDDGLVYPFSIPGKLGTLNLRVLIIGLVVLLASLGFLWFLWMANSQNSVWRAIAARDWVPRAITLCSLGIRQSISLQASASTAMIACLALEYAIVPLLSLASVSTTRNANGGPYMLSWWLWKGFLHNQQRWRTVHWPLLVVILATTTALLQITSFALLSDVALVNVQDYDTDDRVPTHFQYNSNGTIPVFTHGTTWSQYLQAYASFAEYHEPPMVKLPEGVLDTGPTLRAFLPIADTVNRGMIAHWDGIATVLDARAVCVRPELLDPRVYYAEESIALTTGWRTNGEDLSALGLERDPYDNDPAAVACMLPLAPLTYSIGGSSERNLARYPQWRLAICQSASVGRDSVPNFALPSQFVAPEDTFNRTSTGEDNYSFGVAYVMVNVTSGSEADWILAIPADDNDLGLFKGPGTAPLGYTVHGQNNEWYDLIYSENENLKLSVSICYTAFDTADLHVVMDAYGNHTDIAPSWDASKQKFDYRKILTMLGQNPNGSATYPADYAARNIMQLHKRESWIPDANHGDYIFPKYRITGTSWITDYSNMAGSLESNNYNYAVGSNQTSFLWQGYEVSDIWRYQLGYAYADTALMGLVQEILQTGGSLAFAMQSIVTYLTELAYYQQVLQLNGYSDTSSSSYVLVSAPIRMRGILAVTIVLGINLLAVFGIILPSFLMWTKISALGNAWQAIAQAIDPKVQSILDKASLATDDVAEKAVKIPTGKKGKMKNRETVGLCSADGVTVHVVSCRGKIDEENLVASAPPEGVDSEANHPVLDWRSAHGRGHDENAHENDNLLRQDVQGEKVGD